MKSLSIILVALFLLSGCECGEEPVIQSSYNEYLPLKIGNTWKFRNPHSPQNGNYVFKKVGDIIYKNGYQYYVVTSDHSGTEEIIDQITYFRITPDGYVYTLDKHASKEENPFR